MKNDSKNQHHSPSAKPAQKPLLRTLSKTAGLRQKTKPSSQRWLLRHLNDPYVQQAQAQGFRCRSAFKLQEIQQRFHIFSPGQKVLDLGCAPGGWCQVVEKIIFENQSQEDASFLLGIDRLAIKPLKYAKFIQGDILEESTQAFIQEHTFDVILSDMAPSLTGDKSADRSQMEELLEMVWTLSLDHLAERGTLVMKVFHSPWLKTLEPFFKKTSYTKPEASRSQSREIYWVGLGFSPHKKKSP